MTTAFYATVDTPDGPFTVITLDGDVIAAGWTTDTDDLLSRVHPTLQPTELIGDAAETQRAADAVRRYYEGDFSVSGITPVRQVGGEFIQRCWDALREVPTGTTVSYTTLASQAGNPRANRAAATACAQNAVALFVPCHRVLRKDGSTGGFRYGSQLKENLLAREESGHA